MTNRPRKDWASKMADHRRLAAQLAAVTLKYCEPGSYFWAVNKALAAGDTDKAMCIVASANHRDSEEAEHDN